LWKDIETFAEYGFNKSLGENTKVITTNGLVKIKDIIPNETFVYTLDKEGNRIPTKVLALHDHGKLECVKIRFKDGSEVYCTLNHKFMTKQGMKPLKEIIASNLSVIHNKN
jgi:intein/homing endonuclease